MRFQSSTNTNDQWFAGIDFIMPRQSLRLKNLSRAIAVMLNVDMYTETPCKKTLEIHCVIFCHHHHQIAIIINHHHHYHHRDHHNLTVQAGTMKQGILPRNHLPVKAVIGVMGAAVRHISWSNIIIKCKMSVCPFNDGYGCEVQHPQKVLSVNVFKIRKNQKFSPYLRVPCCKPASWSLSIGFGF